jgi:hypothetical protein
VLTFYVEKLRGKLPRENYTRFFVVFSIRKAFSKWISSSMKSQRSCLKDFRQFSILHATHGLFQVSTKAFRHTNKSSGLPISTQPFQEANEPSLTHQQASNFSNGSQILHEAIKLPTASKPSHTFNQKSPNLRNRFSGS